jgi:Holliday junction resolvase
MKKEQDIQGKIMDYISSIGGIPLKYNNMGIYATAGVSDIIACIKGRFVAIEVKKPGNTPSKLQENFIDSVNLINGVAFWADNLEDVKTQLKTANLI